MGRRMIFMTAEAEVRSASDKFYAALNQMIKGDAGPMVNVWSHGATVTTMHPIGGREVGWESVKRSWEQVAQIAKGGKGGQVKLVDQRIEVAGDVAYELGVERGQADLAGQHVTFADRVTNIYRKESGTWKLVHHHTDISQA